MSRMFETSERQRIRDELIAAARDDPEVIGAAIVGSAARGQEDRWSDIDLALQLADGATELGVVERWTQLIDGNFGVADTLDIFAGGVRYRVFLLSSSLQIDLSFWPHDEFRATEEAFHLVFGNPAPQSTATLPDIDGIIGMGWLYALHARSAFARGRLWQTVMMLDELRNQIVALACIRNGLNPWHGRDVDRLPPAERNALDESRAMAVSTAALGRSKRILIRQFLAEVGHHNSGLADALRPALEAMASDA